MAYIRTGYFYLIRHWPNPNGRRVCCIFRVYRTSTH